jgi:hypothetical protein
VNHGRLSTYVNRRCRCDECRAANAAYKRRHKAAQALSPIPADIHGSINAYVNRDCHCQPCRNAWSAYMRAYRTRKRAAAST